jgi:hypothetical protein
MRSILISLLFFAAASAAAESPTACDLLSGRDVQAVQGQAFAEAKHTQSRFDGMITSQCFYRLPSFVDSISVEVIRSESPGTNANDLWQTITGKRAEKMTAKGRDHSQTIDNLGDIAIWAGNKTAGALYVLANDVILRISVGGAGTEQEKIEKSRKLAAAALKKF